MCHNPYRIVLLYLWFLVPGSLGAVEIIAHRGASFDAPENTLSAMKLAWEQGADSIELDLWLSQDGKLVVFHDADTKRFESTARKVATLSWDELKKLDVGSWKGEKYKSERIPTVEGILATIPSRRRAILEIKCGPEILPELSRAIRSSGRNPSELAIITFRYDTLTESTKMFPQIEHFFLHDYKKDSSGKLPELDALITQCRAAGAHGLDLSYQWPITAEFVAKVKAANLKLIVWTVDDAIVARQLVAAGVDGITTNRPRWLREQLEARNPAVQKE